MVKHIHIIDPDVRRRARVSRELLTRSAHVEIYEDIDEFLELGPEEGLIFAADELGTDGQRVSQLIHGKDFRLPTIVYAEAPSTEMVVEAMRAGAYGYLDWPFDHRELEGALRRVSDDGERRQLQERLISHASARVAALSNRETQVLTALICGLSNKQIGESLQISHRTVEIHRSNMMSKLRARSVADAVRMGLYAGLAEFELPQLRRVA